MTDKEKKKMIVNMKPSVNTDTTIENVASNISNNNDDKLARQAPQTVLGFLSSNSNESESTVPVNAISEVPVTKTISSLPPLVRQRKATLDQKSLVPINTGIASSISFKNSSPSSLISILTPHVQSILGNRNIHTTPLSPFVLGSGFSAATIVPQLSLRAETLSGLVRESAQATSSVLREKSLAASASADSFANKATVARSMSPMLATIPAMSMSPHILGMPALNSSNNAIVDSPAFVPTPLNELPQSENSPPLSRLQSLELPISGIMQKKDSFRNTMTPSFSSVNFAHGNSPLRVLAASRVAAMSSLRNNNNVQPQVNNQDIDSNTGDNVQISLSNSSPLYNYSVNMPIAEEDANTIAILHVQEVEAAATSASWEAAALAAAATQIEATAAIELAQLASKELAPAPSGWFQLTLEFLHLLPRYVHRKRIAMGIWGEPKFWFIAISMALYVAAMTISEVFIGVFASESGALASFDEKDQASAVGFLYAALGFAGIISRLVFGLITLRYDISLAFVIKVCVICVGFSMMLLPIYGNTYWYLLLFSSVQGALGAITFSTSGPYLSQLFGIVALPFALGGTYTIRAPVVLFAAPLAGYFRDITGTFTDVWVLGGLTLIFSAFPISLIDCSCKRINTQVYELNNKE
jgi:hypothetical protein